MIALLLAIGVAATAPIALTQAKYAVSRTATGSAAVAKWDPSVAEFTDGFSKTAFLASDQTFWLPINDKNMLTPVPPAHNREAEYAAFILKPDNANCEVAADYWWEITTSATSAPGDFLTNRQAEGWTPTKWGTDRIEDSSISNLLANINVLNDEPGYTRVGPLETKDEVFVNLFPGIGHRPWAEANSYMKIYFSWTAEQVD